MDELLLNSQILVCAGSGGVGKTTVAASLAVRAAELGLKVLVLTVDPAKRLATTLGLKVSNEETRVPHQQFKGELFAAVLDSKAIFDEFVRTSAENAELAERLMKNPLYVQLSTALSGAQEFTALEKLHTVRTQGRYDLVVLDTPPTQHALDFLVAPEKIENLFQESITKWFKPTGRTGWLASLLSTGTKQALKALEVLTGRQFIETLVHFFMSIQTLQATLHSHAAQVREMLIDDKTKFILVASFDIAKLNEADYFLHQLEKRGCHLGAVVINRAFPDWQGEAPAAGPLKDLYDQLKKSSQTRIAGYEKFQKTWDEHVTVFKIPEFNHDISQLSGLGAFYGSLRA